MLEYVHFVPGRLRIKIAELRHRRNAAEAEANVGAIAIVKSAVVNPITGSLTIVYDHQRASIGDLWNPCGRKVMSQTGAPSPSRPGLRLRATQTPLDLGERSCGPSSKPPSSIRRTSSSEHCSSLGPLCVAEPETNRVAVLSGVLECNRRPFRRDLQKFRARIATLPDQRRGGRSENRRPSVKCGFRTSRDVGYVAKPAGSSTARTSAQSRGRDVIARSGGRALHRHDTRAATGVLDPVG